MRASELVSEIKRAGSTRYSGGARALDMWDTDARRARFERYSKPLSSMPEFNFYVEKNNLGYEIFIINPKDEDFPIVGQLGLSRRNDFPEPAVMVDVITVHEKYRGRGIASALYRIVLFDLGLTLLAGSEQTPGGRKNWLKIAEMPGVEVKGYVPIDDRDFDDPDAYRNYTSKMINKVMSAGGEYLGRSRGAQIRVPSHYFLFDVVPGTGELEPAAKDALKLYHKHDVFITPGLLARAANK